MLGRRLKLARTAAGLSLRDLEIKIGNIVSAQAIGKYERNEMMPGSKALAAIAQALGVSENYLAAQPDISLEGIEFRKNKITSKREEAHVEAAVMSFLEKYLEIETILQVPSLEWEEPRQSSLYVTDIVEGELAAKSLREQWNLGSDPILGLAEFLEEKGIKVLSLELPASVSGLTCLVRRLNGSCVPVIVINTLDMGERQRFTLAHEIGHMVLSLDQNVDEEKAAHRFAGAFLMPSELLRAEIGVHRKSLSLGELLVLKKMLGVSVQAITYRCKDLGIINQATYRGLFEIFAKKGWRTPPYNEPEPIPKEEPQRFKRLCFRALAEDAICEAKAAELLGMTVRRLNQEMETDC
jgi:Zn-dependent peptidase ImmA (M78 family)